MSTVDLPVVSAEQLLESLDSATFPVGETLIEQGAEPGSVYVLHTGRVEVQRDGRTICTYDEPGALFGEIAVLLDRPHDVSFVAADTAHVHIIDDFDAMVAKHPEHLYALARSLARRLASMDHAFVQMRGEMDALVAAAPADSEEQKELKSRVARIWDQFGEVMRTRIA